MPPYIASGMDFLYTSCQILIYERETKREIWFNIIYSS